MPLASSLPSWMALGMATVLLAWSSFAQAAPGCPIVLGPPDAGKAWHKAMLDAAKRIAEMAPSSHDCQAVEIAVQPEGNALLTFMTADGRRAARLLHDPADILPALEALLVTLPPELPSPKETTSAERADRPAETTSAHGRNKPVEVPKEAPKPASSKGFDAPKASPQASRMHFLFGAGMGGRVTLDEALLTPTLVLHASMKQGSWELGVRGESAPSYTPLVEIVPTGFSMSSFAIEITAGRRHTFRRFEWPFGISMGITTIREEIDIDPALKGRENIMAFAPRVGLRGGFVYPRDQKTRFSFSLNVDAALGKLRIVRTEALGLPAVPRFGVGITLGMEVAP